MGVRSKSILKTLERYEPRSLHHEVPVVWEWAQGHEVGSLESYHAPGLVNFVPKKYIDFTSGIFVANIGHSHQKVMNAICEQLSRPLLHSYTFPNEPRAKLVAKLAEISGMDKVFLCSTGSEAIEVAYKIMTLLRPWSYVISFEGQNHGRTLAADSLSGRRITTSVLHYPNPRELLDADQRYLAGIFIESYQAWGAVFYDPKDIQDLCAWAKESDVIVCFDEIQSGFGRTGKLFAYEHYGVEPDLVCVGKALGGGMPISAVMGRADLLDLPDDLTSTHTGNPVCCAAALASIEVLEEEGLVERAATLGELLGDTLHKLFPDFIVMGRGMVWAIHLNDIELANRVVDKAAEKGLLLVKTYKGTIKIGPPLMIPEAVLFDGVKILKEVIESEGN